MVPSSQPRERARNANETISKEWYPWPDKIVGILFLQDLPQLIFVSQSCTIDILMHLHRSVFSERQLDILIWLLRINEVNDVPSVKTMKNLEDMLQSMCGINSIPYNGALGHRYYVNSLADIIRQVKSANIINALQLPLIDFLGNGKSSCSS